MRQTVRKASVIGLFCTGQAVSDGQSIKTRIFTGELEKAYGTETISRIDTFGWKHHPFRLLRNCLSAVRDSEHVIFMTDAGGIKVFPWVLLGANAFYRRRIHYVVIGGWLGEYLKTHRVLAGCLKRLHRIYPETSRMADALRELGFANVRRMPNCKDLMPLGEEQLVLPEAPYPFCTFSRVMKEKGIADAVEAVRAVNERFGKTVCTLDIYGAVDPLEKDWFAALSAVFPPEIRYCGVVPFEKSVEIVKHYFALLFPTFYPSEGIPGTVLDAYAAGVPVIASRWSGFPDIIREGETGLGYPYLHNEQLAQVLEQAIRNPRSLLEMKKACLKAAESFTPEQVIRILLQEMEE